MRIERHTFGFVYMSYKMEFEIIYVTAAENH